jgi:hypothetical protein
MFNGDRPSKGKADELNFPKSLLSETQGRVYGEDRGQMVLAHRSRILKKKPLLS